MGKVVYDISMSLDGFITAAGQTPAEPMGAGGERLHDWAFGDDESATAGCSAPASPAPER